MKRGPEEDDDEEQRQLRQLLRSQRDMALLQARGDAPQPNASSMVELEELPRLEVSNKDR